MLGIGGTWLCAPSYVLGILTGIPVGWWIVWYMRRRPKKGDWGHPREMQERKGADNA